MQISNIKNSPPQVHFSASNIKNSPPQVHFSASYKKECANKTVGNWELQKYKVLSSSLK